MTKIEIFDSAIELLDKVRGQILELQKKHLEIERYVLSICPHKDTKITEKYIPGDYYTKSQFIKTTICDFCNKTWIEITYGNS
jgi:hypothetical protein